MNGPVDFERRKQLLRLATTSSVATALVLIVAKLVASLLTGSVAVLASLIDSTMDALASVINLFAVRYALQPADEEHRFGHGKAESLAGLGQAAFIAGSAGFLILQAIDRLLNPAELKQPMVGIAVMVFAIVATLILLLIQRHVIRVTGSTAIKADALHYFTDLITNASIILALVLAMYGWPGLDPLFGIGIALYVLYNAWEIGKEAVSHLMDRELSPDIRERMVALAHEPEEVLGVHDMRTRQSGQMYFVQIHLEMDDHLPLSRVHDVAESVEQKIRREFPGTEVIIHQDPVGIVNHDQVVVEPPPDEAPAAH
jgi:ferrous-iron efflux pump FieF